MKRVWSLVALAAFTVALAASAHAADDLIGGKQFAASAKAKMKIQAKDASVVVGTADPTMSGATLKVFDEGGMGGTDYTISLPSTGWSGDATKGFKYKGAGSGSDPCKGAKLKAGQLKIKCQGLSPVPVVPFTGNAGVVLSIGTDNYCLEFPIAGASNDAKGVKIKGAFPPPAMCPSLAPPGCPLAAGAYTITQVSGGQLAVYGFAPFPFPSGGTIVEDVAAASLPDCVHDVVVPGPTGGFTAPNFCVPALNLTTSVTQTGCGIGKIDSNGGSDFDTNEIGDTSDSSVTCNLPQPGCVFGANHSLRVDITVGNGVADTCVAPGTANALVTVPVHTVSWHDNSAGTFQGCPGDGIFDVADTVIAEFDQILDFTTAPAQGHWADIDGDGCSLAGLGPAAGYMNTSATCMDLTGGTVVTAAVGEFGSTGGTFDGSFSTTLPNTITGPAAPLGATCAMPPVINFAGTATRCIP